MEVHVTGDLEYHLYSTHAAQTVTNGTNGQYRLFIHGHKRALSDTYLPIGKKKHFSKVIFIPNQPDQFLYNDSEAHEKVVQAKESGASAKESASEK
jgi:hypothetical protein